MRMFNRKSVKRAAVAALTAVMIFSQSSVVMADTASNHAADGTDAYAAAATTISGTAVKEDSAASDAAGAGKTAAAGTSTAEAGASENATTGASMQATATGAGTSTDTATTAGAGMSMDTASTAGSLTHADNSTGAATTAAIEESAEAADTEDIATTEGATDDKTETASDGTLTFENDAIRVKADFTKDAEIPEGAELSVSMIGEDDEAYDSYKKIAEDKVSGVLDYLKLYDISIVKDGGEIEPKAPVTVSIEHTDGASLPEDETIEILHMTEDGSAETLEASASMSSAPVMRRAAARNAVSAPAVTAATATARSARKTYSGATFKTGSFSVFAEAGSLKTVVVTAEGENYTAAVTFGKDAGIPAGAVLTAKELTGDAGDEYRQKAAEALGEQEITQARFFDIHFTVDGKEQEPAPGASVQVRLAFSDSMEVGKSGEVKAVHFKEGADGVTPEILDTETSALSSRPDNTTAATDSDAGGEMTAFDVVDFTQGSFSVMGVVVTGDKLQDGWPKQDSIYVTLLTKNGIHYAVKNDGTLLKVNIDDDGKVIFDDDEKLVDYLWVTDKATHRIIQNTGDSPVYLDPERGVVNVEPSFFDVNIVSDANGEYYLQSEEKHNYYYGYRYNYFITVGEEKVSRTYNKDDAATISFADFRAKTSESGGTTPGENLEKPETKKTCEPNGDGTYNLSLSIKGKTDTSSESNMADVIVVLDVSGSMDENEYEYTDYGWKSKSRLEVAKTAVNSLAKNLLENNTTDNPDLVHMSLITFANYATEMITDTNNYSEFEKAVKSLKANGGTNWEDALKTADDLKTRDGADVYVIFVSDGDPTFRNTQGGSVEYDIYKEYASHISDSHSYYGSGNSDRYSLNYKYALVRAMSIVLKGKEFYTVGAFGDVSEMQRLTKEAGAPVSNYQEASNTEALNNAFKNIINKITHNLGYQSVSFHDGLTQMTSTSLELVDAAADEFVYEVLDADGKRVQVTQDGNTYSYSIGKVTRKFNGAAYDKEKRVVTWSMNDGPNPFELDDGYTYKVSFKVWPSQQAYDLLADLKNEKKSYDELLGVDKEQIIKNGDGTYSLQTNTDDTSVTYTPVTTTTDSSGNSTSQTLQPETASIENPDGIPLTVARITVKKEWDDGGNAQSQRPETISFDLVQDKDDEKHNSKFIENAELKGNNWSKEIYIAPGLIVKDKSGKYQTLNAGHTYDIVENNIDAHYELSTKTYHPMLVKTDDGVKIYNYEDGKLSDSPISEFTAENKLKGSLSLEKKVFNANGDKDITFKDDKVNPAISDETFSYQVTLVAPRERTAVDFKYQLVKQDGTSAESQTLGNVADTISNYRLTPNGTGDTATTTVTFTVTLEPGEKLELPFLPLDTKYTITEKETNGYNLKDITVTDENGTRTQSGPSTDVIGANQTDAVVFSNQFASAFNLMLLKTNDSTEPQKLAGAEFTLKKVNGEAEADAYNIEGTAIGTENNPIKSGTNAVSIGDLPSGKYRLTETKAPDGYTKLEKPVEFTVDRAKAGQAEVAVKIISNETTVATVSQDSNKTDYTITIQNKAIYVLPHSGGNGVVPYMVAGVVLMLVAAGVLGTGGVLRKGGGSY